MISAIPTYSWTSIRIRKSWRVVALAGIALVAAAMVNEPWITLLMVSLAYLISVPFSLISYSRVKRRRATRPSPLPAASAAPDSAD
jgi:CDP-diacylglycerol--serine O-phosphatidyltransferase